MEKVEIYNTLEKVPFYF